MPEEEGEGEGEDLLDNAARDYQRIDALDRYGTEGLDDRDYGGMSADQRMAAEAELTEREGGERGGGGGRGGEDGGILRRPREGGGGRGGRRGQEGQEETLPILLRTGGGATTVTTGTTTTTEITIRTGAAQEGEKGPGGRTRTS